MAAAGDASGGVAEDAELAADVDDLRTDGAAVGYVGQARIGGTGREELGLEGFGAAQAAGDAGEDGGAVVGAEAFDEDGEVGMGGTPAEGSGELPAAEDEPMDEEEEGEPAEAGEQTHCGCRGVG
jgi:hypothetical protein